MTSKELSFIRVTWETNQEFSYSKACRFTVIHGLGYVLPNPLIKVRR